MSKKQEKIKKELWEALEDAYANSTSQSPKLCSIHCSRKPKHKGYCVFTAKMPNR